MTVTLDVVDRLRDLPEADLQYRSRAELETLREELRTAQNDAWAVVKRIADTSKGRTLTKPQQADSDAALRRTDEAGQLLEAVERTLAAKQIDYSQILNVAGIDARDLVVGSKDQYTDGAPLTRSQTMTGFARARGLVSVDEPELSLRKFMRGMVLGDWTDADRERRAMSEGVLAGGGYMVPTTLSAQIIDLARNQTRVLQAGAQLVPMATKTVTVARWEGDPTLAWHSENAAIAASDATLGAVTLDAKALTGRVVFSRELLEDASGIDAQVRQAFAAQLALTLDRAALYGSGTAPEPRGVRNTSGVTLQSMGTDGAPLAGYSPLIDAVGALRDANEEPTGIIYSPRSQRAIETLTAADDQPLMPPPYIADIPRYASANIPNDQTHGTATNATDVFTADWRQLALGVRTELQLTPLVERYADTGQVGLLAWWRGDVAVLRPAAFVVTTGVTA